MYDSKTKDWSIVESREKSWGWILGHWYALKNEGSCHDGERGMSWFMSIGPCLYDFAWGQLHHYKVYEILQECLAMSHAMN